MKPALALMLSIASALLIGCPAKMPDLSGCVPPEGKYDVRIMRDEYGVPHVYGKTDADVAYGLAWAHCEDDFDTIQEVLLTGRGRLSEIRRHQGLMTDMFVRAFRVQETVAEKYEADLSPEIRAICEAYAQGVNHYAATHPEACYARIVLPATGQDIVCGFTLRAPFFYFLPRHLQGLLEGGPRFGRTRSACNMPDDSVASTEIQRGSNAFAVAPSRSADGFTRLAVNSHQPWTGPVAWYEARLHSEEGMDTVGGLFPGTPVVLHGHNRNLGWAHTTNMPDLCDVYRLTVNPDNPDQYQFDGAWRNFEKETARIRLRLWGPLTITVKRELLWTVHGPALRTKDGVFAISYAGQGEIRAVEQWYRMGKARNLDEFRQAMELRAILALNTVYADREGNIWYLYNANLPERSPDYDWTGRVPGDTSRTLWGALLPFDTLPQVLNPPSGFVQNCNSDPFQTTFGPGNPLRENCTQAWAMPDQMTNRALRLHEMFGADESVTRDDFYTYKFDWNYTRTSKVGDLLDRMKALAPFDDPLMNEGIEIINHWDYSTAPESVGTALAVLTGEPVIRAEMFGNPPPDLEKMFREACHYLQDHHGRLDVPWGEVNRMVRGSLNIRLGGGPDTLYAVYGTKQSDGTLHGHSGDSYVLMVEWDPQGHVSSRSLHNFGSATTRPDSPHYADQTELFQQRTTKPVHFDEADLKPFVAREYRPGDT